MGSELKLSHTTLSLEYRNQHRGKHGSDDEPVAGEQHYILLHDR
jgi:hypothetical protein